MSVFLPPSPRILPSLRTTNAVCRPSVRPPVSYQVFPLSRLAHRRECPPTASLATYIVSSEVLNAFVIGCGEKPPTGSESNGKEIFDQVAPLSFEVCQRNGTPAKPTPPV